MIKLYDKEIIPTWSNLPFIIPGVIAVYKGFFVYASLIILAGVVSSVYHYSHEKKFKNLDNFVAISLILANSYIIYLSHFKQPYFTLAITFVVLASIFYYKGRKDSYASYHGLWHLCSVLITTMCVLAY